MPAPDFVTEIAALEAGLSSGEARIESDGDMIWYRGVPDILAALSYFRSKAAAGNRALTRSSSSVAVYNRD